MPKTIHGKTQEQLAQRAPAANSIVYYVHCSRCLEEMPRGTSPQDFQRVQVGFTLAGLQVWCVRHGLNIMHVDFEGCKHPANVGTE